MNKKVEEYKRFSIFMDKIFKDDITLEEKFYDLITEEEGFTAGDKVGYNFLEELQAL